MKRVLSLVVALSMLLTVVPAAFSAAGESGYSDVDGTSYETPVSILKALGIMSGYTDGNFHPYQTITRAEMASVCVHMRGVTDYGSKASIEEVQYKDMDGHPAEAVVAYARSMGIIDGYEDGYFYPDDPVTYEQAVKMIVGSLGYDYYATANGEYPTGYLKVAADLKLTAGVGLTIGSYITRGDVAKIVYNALTVDIMEATKYSTNNNDVTYEIKEGKNLLNTYFDVEELRGTIDQTGYTTLVGETPLNDDEVRIGNEIFNVGSTNIASYLGYYVTFYALDTDDYNKRVIISYKVESSKNDYIKISGEDVENVELTSSSYVIEYWRSKTEKTTKKVKISKTPYVIYNGVALTDFLLDDLAPDYGQLTLIDTDRDGLYDVVDVLHYNIMLVLSSSSSNSSVTAAYSTGSRSVKLDEEDDDYNVKIIDGEGNTVPFSSISKNTVLNVAVSKDEGQTVRTVIVSNDKVNGTIKSINDDGEYIINGVAYEAVSYMKNDQTMAVGDTGDFFLTYDGKIAGFDGDSKISKNIGMFISWNAGGIADGGDVVKIMKADGTFGIYEFAAKVKVNGETYNGKQVFKWVSGQETNPFFGDEHLFGDYEKNENSGKTIADPSRSGILFKTNSKGDISELVIATQTYDASLGDENPELTYAKRGRIIESDNRDDSLYYSTKYHCFHRKDRKVFVTDASIIFMSADNYTKTDDSQIFSVTTPSSMWNNQYFEYYASYFYYVNGKEYSDFAVFYDDYDADDGSSLKDENYGRYSMWDRIRVVDRVTEYYDDDDYRWYRLMYYEGGSSLKYKDFHDDAPEDLCYRNRRESTTDKQLWRRGDMVRFIDTDGKISSIQSIFSDFVSESGNAWNNPRGNELTGGRENNHHYYFPVGYYYRWGDSSYNNNVVQRYYIGRVTSINTMKYFSTLQIRYGATEFLSDEPIEGDCFRFIYDNRGYINGVENVGNGAIAEDQLVLSRKNGTNEQIGCRIAETYILYDYDEVEEVMDDMKSTGSSYYSAYSAIYPEFAK